MAADAAPAGMNVPAPGLPGGGEWPQWCRNCPSTPKGLAEASVRLQSVLGDAKAEVLLSCLEFIEPHPDQAVEILAGKGLNEVVIMPYLLGHGKHATDELEEVLDDVKRSTPQVKPRLAGGFGADSRLADLVVDRVRDLDGTPGVAPSHEQTVGVLIVKAGTKTQYDNCAWLRELGQMVDRQLGPGYAVDVAQSHYGDPTMESASACLVEERGVSTLVCVPYLFFPGMILRRQRAGRNDSSAGEVSAHSHARCPAAGSGRPLSGGGRRPDTRGLGLVNQGACDGRSRTRPTTPRCNMAEQQMPKGNPESDYSRPTVRNRRGDATGYTTGSCAAARPRPPR